jgi:hypothetical protein
MLRALIAVLVVAVAMPLLPTAVAGPAPSLFPLVVGAEWVRKSEDGTEARSRVVGPKTAGTTRCIVVERKAVERGRERTTTTCYLATAAEVLVIESTTPRGGLTTLNPPRPLLKLPPRVGQTWSWSPVDSVFELKITDRWVGEETVRVPAGTFRAWKLQTVTTGEDSEITAFTWYAPGVGMVRTERKGYRGDRQISGWSELVRYRIP